MEKKWKRKKAEELKSEIPMISNVSVLPILPAVFLHSHHRMPWSSSPTAVSAEFGKQLMEKRSIPVAAKTWVLPK